MNDAMLSNELSYQKHRAMEIGQLAPTAGYVVERYRYHRSWRLFNKEFIFKSCGELQGKKVLDFGCGEGQLATQMGLLGAQVTGIDISPELIELARRRAELDRVEKNVEFSVCDVLKTAPAENTYDLVVCTDALHHVELPAVVDVLYRCLKPGGKLIVKEPVSLSPSLQKIRDRLPFEKDASPGDRQLEQKDLEYLRRGFSNSQIMYFRFLGRLSRFLANANSIDRGHPFTRTAMKALLSLDWLLALSFPFLRRFYGEVVFVGETPIS